MAIFSSHLLDATDGSHAGNIDVIIYQIKENGDKEIFFKSKFSKILVFSLVFSLSFSVWFIKPGSAEIAPVTSIFLMELFIVEEHGFLRLFRPIITIFVLCITFIIFYNFLFRKK